MRTEKRTLRNLIWWFMHCFDTLMSNPYVLITPTLMLFGGFLLYPVLFLFFVSFHYWNGVGPIGDFVGFKNYVQIFFDPLTRSSLINTAQLIAASSVLQVGGALILALLIMNVTRGRAVFRTIFFLPCTLSLVATGLVWSWIYDPELGLLNNYLATLGLESWKRIWLGTTQTALPSVIVAYAWQWAGVYVVIFLAGLQGIPPEYFEVAQIEGGSGLQVFWHVILPSIRSEIYITLMLCLVFSLKLLPLVYVMTNGGPGRATEVLGLSVYKVGFYFYRMGLASALGFFMLLTVVVAALVYTRFIKRGIEYAQ